jgi:hypothetical protein
VFKAQQIITLAQDLNKQNYNVDEGALNKFSNDVLGALQEQTEMRRDEF